jgi:hypothetical protein
MKTRLIVALCLIEASPAASQVRIGFQLGSPPPPPYTEVVVVPPFSGAVWIGGQWIWDEYDGRYTWTEGHWVGKHPPQVWRGKAWKHIPNGVAKGWWKKHGRGW